MGGGAAGAGGATTWCATHGRPADVAVADFRCLDFDTGLPPASAWTPTLQGMGQLATSTARAASPPSSLQNTIGAQPSFSQSQTATLTWNDVGAAGITSATVTASFNASAAAGVAPAWTGSVDLLCIEMGGGEACLSYTFQGDTSFASNYTGYFIAFTYTGGAAFRFDCPVTGTLAPNLWTSVSMQVTSAGHINVALNGTASPVCDGTTTLNDAAVKTTLGLAGHAVTSTNVVYFIDNVLVAVRRAP